MTAKIASGALALALAVAAVTAGSATAQPGRWGGGPPGGGGGVLPLLLRSANLTPEQDTKIKEMVATRRAAMRTLMQQMRDAEDELAGKLLAPGTVQLADVQPQLQRIAQLRDQQLRESTQAALTIRALLTQEQIARVAQTNERVRQLQRELRQLERGGS